MTSQQLKESLKMIDNKIQEIEDIYYGDGDGYDEAKDFLESEKNTLFDTQIYPETYFELDPEKVKQFITTHTIKLLEAEIERLRVVMREHGELCPTNLSGDRCTSDTCDALDYNQALQDQITHLQEQIKNIKETL